MPTARQIEQRRRYARLLQEKGMDDSPTTGLGALARAVKGGLGSYIREQADRMDKERKDEALRHLAAASQITFTPTFVGDDTGVESVTEDPRGALVNTIARSMDEPGKMMPFVLKTLSDEMASDRARQQALADLASKRDWEAEQRQLDREATAEQERLKREAADEREQRKRDTPSERERAEQTVIRLRREKRERPDQWTREKQDALELAEARTVGRVTSDGSKRMTGGKTAEILADHSKTLKMARQFGAAAHRALKNLEDVPGAATGVADLSSLGERLSANLKALGRQIFDSKNITLDFNPDDNNFMRRMFLDTNLAGASAAHKRNVLALALLDAGVNGQSGRSLSDKDMERHIRPYLTGSPNQIQRVIQAAAAQFKDKVRISAEEAHRITDEPLDKLGSVAPEIEALLAPEEAGIGAASSGGNPLAGTNPNFSNMTLDQLAQIDRQSLTTPQLRAMLKRLEEVRGIGNKALGQ